MKPQQMIEFFASSEERTKKGLAVALESRNYWLASTNYKQSLKAHLMQALIKWRHNLGSPEKEIENSISIARNALFALRELDPQVPLWRAFPVSIPPVLSALLAQAPEPALVELVPPPSQWSELARDHAEVVREASLALALVEPARATELLEALRQLPAQRQEALAQESHELYLSLLSPEADVLVETRLHRAEMLFQERRKNPRYAGGVQYYGGGPDNENVVDFMLAAVLKRVAPASASVHAWRWA